MQTPFLLVLLTIGCTGGSGDTGAGRTERQGTDSGEPAGDSGTDTGSDDTGLGDSGDSEAETGGDTGECTGPSEPSIVVTPERVDFGDVDLGFSTSAELLITNEGSVNLAITDVQTAIGVDDGGTLRVSDPGAILLPGCSATSMNLTFTPESPGEVTATLTIASTDPDNPLVAVEVVGLGVGPEIVVSPTEYDFGTVCIGCGADAAFDLQNIGNADLTFTAGSLISASGELTLDLMESDYGALPDRLAPGETRTFILSYNPVDDYYDEAVIVLESDDPKTQELQVRAQGNGG